MREFYVLDLDCGEMYYFKNKENARKALWHLYEENCSYESDELKEAAKRQFDEFGFMESIGSVYTEYFED